MTERTLVGSWVPCSSRMPADSSIVLTWFVTKPGGRPDLARWYGEENRWNVEGLGDFHPQWVTHWCAVRWPDPIHAELAPQFACRVRVAFAVEVDQMLRERIRKEPIPPLGDLSFCRGRVQGLLDVVYSLESLCRDYERGYLKGYGDDGEFSAACTRADAAEHALDDIARLFKLEKWSEAGEVVAQIRRELEWASDIRTAINLGVARSENAALKEDVRALKLELDFARAREQELTGELAVARVGIGRAP